MVQSYVIDILKNCSPVALSFSERLQLSAGVLFVILVFDVLFLLNLVSNKALYVYLHRKNIYGTTHGV